MDFPFPSPDNDSLREISQKFLPTIAQRREKLAACHLFATILRHHLAIDERKDR